MEQLQQMEQVFADAASNQEIPGVVLLAADRHGRFRYAHSFGSRSVKGPPELMNLDTPIWMASWTKLMTAIAILQCVENSLIALDQDVTLILPELGVQPILKGFDEISGRPILEGRRTPITVIQLLTHTAGLSYDFFSPLLRKWRSYTGIRRDSRSNLIEEFSYPLVYEPGTSWEYSATYEWLGILLERVTGCVSLGTHMNTYIWTPLSLKHITFRPREHPLIKNNLAMLSMRDSSGSGKVQFTTNPWEKYPITGDSGGGGAYGSPMDFIQILESLLKNDGKLLNPETVDYLLKPQLEGFNRNTKFGQKITVTKAYDALGGFPHGTKKDWAIAGLVNCENLDGRRRKGSVTCIGMANSCWWMDREAGLCGVYATGDYPVTDAKSIALRRLFEMTMYNRFQAGQMKL